MKSRIKVLIVDDSAFMRKSISIMLESDEEIEVVATARDGLEGYNLVRTLRPDVVTLDIEMPKMDGLTALQKIMKDCPTPVMMVSSLTTEGAEATMKALEYGAVDFIPKELSYVNVNIIQIREELIKKVKEIVRQKSLQQRLERIRKYSVKSVNTAVPFGKVTGTIPRFNFRAVTIGISTGGPLSLQKVIPGLSPKLNCPIFIVQHMPPKFTKSLANRLDAMSELSVKEAEEGDIIKPNSVYLAPGGFHMLLQKNSGTVVVNISSEPSNTLHRPAVDVMMNSVLDIYGKNTLGVIMTGMGKDGLEGITRLKSLGGYSVTQSEETCVVYGMPRAVDEAGKSDISAPLEKIAETINNTVINGNSFQRTNF